MTNTSLLQKNTTVFRLATLEDAKNIVSVYEKVFGLKGIKAAGHEAYPAPEVFSIEGVKETISNNCKRFVVATTDGKITGGMIITYLSPFNCEFSCVAVDPDYQGLGISPLMLEYSKQLADKTFLTINNTEIVTHSVLSQTSHNRVGYNKVVGFGYCQYQKVFFRDHPESCLWICDIEGKVANYLKSQRSGTGYEINNILLDEQEQNILNHLSLGRQIYVPSDYQSIVSEILCQFSATIQYSINGDLLSDGKQSQKRIETETAVDAPYGYLKFPDGLYEGWEEDLDIGIQELKQLNKRYIQARIPANYTSAINYANHLKQFGFMLLGLLPLYNYRLDNLGKPIFDDVLALQWLEPKTIEENELPGETNSVIKLYGYPANLSGQLIKTIRRDIKQQKERQ